MFAKRAKSPHLTVLAELLAMPWAITEQQMQAVIASLINARPRARGPRMGHDPLIIAGGVAEIAIRGPIIPQENWYSRNGYATACSALVDQVHHAMSDPKVQRVKFVVDSPGGVALALEEASLIIHRYRGTKPMIAHVTGVCFSAAYYLASAADRIVADPSTSVGSIGAVWYHQDWSGLFEQYGIAITAIQHGKHKTDGSPYRPLDEQGRETMQEWVTSYGLQFDNAVARHRGRTLEEVQSEFGQGKFWIAQGALEVGLIDQVTDPAMDTDSLFEGAEMSKDTSTDTAPAADTKDAGNQEPNALQAAIDKLTATVGTMNENLTAQTARIEKLEAGVATAADGDDNAEASETTESPQLKGIQDSITRLEAKLAHLGGSSDAPVDGADGSSSKKACVYRVKNMPSRN